MSIVAINSRNQFKGVIKQIKRGDVVSEVEVNTGVGIITSVITTSSLDDLKLKPGSEVIALFKSTEVALASFAKV
ncbi:TOBE domain-containing protein [Methylophaga lonarensis]|uniref:TOBE domain-containing protein n=1 Tax=Methylophaga lonarensis TaxID=999151 RepID=UPI003D2DD1B6